MQKLLLGFRIHHVGTSTLIGYARTVGPGAYGLPLFDKPAIILQ